MKNLELTSELFEELFNAEGIYQEENKIGKVIRYALYAGEEFAFSSIRKHMKAVGLEEFETLLKKAEKQEQIKLVLDDGFLHVSIPLELHSKNQLKQIASLLGYELENFQSIAFKRRLEKQKYILNCYK